MRILVTGATGFVGKPLVARIAEPTILSRDVHKAKAEAPQARVFRWRPEEEEPPAEAFEGVEAVIHLAGDPVAEGRWNTEKKRRIRESRVMGTRNLVAALARLEERPRTLVSASAIGYYGSRGDELLEDNAISGRDFLAEVCLAWEHEAYEAEKLGIRVACPRIGLVLGPRGGALAKILSIFKLGLGGRLGSGRQWMSWIHVDDMVGLLLAAASDERWRGAFNAVSPQPVTNAEFTKVLARVVHRPAVLPAPEFGLRLALGEFASILLASQRCVPTQARNWGYSFAYPEIEAALRASV